jgi:stringent starvation protein B
MTQAQKPINPAGYLFPAYLRLFLEIGRLVHVSFVVDHPLVTLKGPVTGIQEYPVPVNIGGQLVKQKKRVLTMNVAPDAVGQWHQNDDGFGFACRFQQQIAHIYVPWDAVLQVGIPDGGQATFILPYLDPDPVAIQERMENLGIAEAPAAAAEEKAERPTHLQRVK